jgi:hypothetical protein
MKKKNSRSYSANFTIKVKKIDFKMLIKRTDSGKFIYENEQEFLLNEDL